MTDGPDDGVLGNLPRSRPGTRSAKRDQPSRQRPKRSSAKRPEAATARAEPARSDAATARAEPARSARPKPVTRPQPARSAPRPDPPPDLVDLTVRAAEAWAGIVLFWPRVAIHVTNAVIRRLPRLF